MVFDEQYFKAIWGGVHRHDYCESVADFLVEKYHPASVLDIGTGCGWLVKVLRDRGIKAYGLEVSDYAAANSHGNVLQGSIINIPFKDKQFDLVYSQGLWEYVNESDIDRAWSECLRVGQHQEHNIDTTSDTAEWSKDFATYKPAEWWNDKLQPPKVLVACPVHIIKEYSFQRWVDNVKNLTHPNYEILVVDNSPDGELVNKYGHQVPMVQLPTKGIEHLAVTRMNRSYELIRQTFLEGDYTHLMCIESDVIPQPEVVEILMGYGGDWISHAYPARNGNDELAQQGIGCSLLSRRLLERFDWKDAEDHTTPDGWLWDRVRPFAYEFPTVELWGVLAIQHLGG